METLDADLMVQYIYSISVHEFGSIIINYMKTRAHVKPMKSKPEKKKRKNYKPTAAVTEVCLTSKQTLAGFWSLF
jgi:hypothetical protein